MAQHQQQWPVAVLCAVLEGSRSGFYAYVHRPTKPRRDTAEATLMARVKAIAAETRSSYGSRRMAKQLQDEGVMVGRHKVRRLMRQAAVTVVRPKKRQARDHRQSACLPSGPESVGAAV
jgi:putative transposase